MGTAIEVVFTERFVRLAKPGGFIAIIVPESIVASDRLGAFRIWLLGKMDLLASVSLPQKIFTGVGANAKTSIIFARRRAQDRPDGWYRPDTLDDSSDKDQPIFLAAPRLDVPGFSTELPGARAGGRAERPQEVLARCGNNGKTLSRCPDAGSDNWPASNPLRHNRWNAGYFEERFRQNEEFN